MGRKGGSCSINERGEKSNIEATKEVGAKERHAKKMKARAADAGKQAAATKKTDAEVKNA